MQLRSMCSIGEGAIESGVELLLLEFEAEKEKSGCTGQGCRYNHDSGTDFRGI